MYENIWDRRVLLADQVRMASYQKAIHEVVKEGDVVADIGTGSGILAFFAIQAGARKVYAIEQGEVIEEARRLAEINGLEKKIVFIKGWSDKIEIPEKVDVITSEIFGCFGLDENIIRFLTDARSRFLKPGGKLIPTWLELYLAPIEWDTFWKDTICLWRGDFYGLDFSPIRAQAVSKKYVEESSGYGKPLASGSMAAHIDFFSEKKVPSILQGKVTITRQGTFHGLVGYFRAGLSPNVILSTAPEQPHTHWKQTFFPLDEEVRVVEGDEVTYKIKAIPQSDTLYWQWDTGVRREGHILAEFSQSDLHFPKEELVIGREDFLPSLSREGEIARTILELCNGKRSIREIAECIQAEFPQRYRSLKDAERSVVSIIRSVVEVP